MQAKKLPQEELQEIITEMTQRVIKVADLVDGLVPDQNLSKGIRDLADTLQGHIKALAIKDISMEELTKMARFDCASTFSLLNVLRANNQEITSDNQLEAINILSTHARELFAALHK